MFNPFLSSCISYNLEVEDIQIEYYFLFCLGVVLAILEKAAVISPVFSQDGFEKMGVGTVSAGWQNFFICIEMFFAAVVLRFAFPHTIYSSGPASTAGRTVSLQSISSSLKETMNPRDIMQDAIHNFHPQYQQYTQQGMKIPHDEDPFESRQPQVDQYQRNQKNGAPPQARPPTNTNVTPQRCFNEKTTLLSSDDEFQ